MVEIVEVTEDLELWCGLVRRAFSTLVKRFDLDEATVPNNGAFMKVEALYRMKDRGVMMYGLLFEGQAIGFVSLEKVKGTKYKLEKLSVLPEYRNLGYGKILVDHGIQVAKGLGGTELSLGLIHGHDALLLWYENIGFQRVKVKKFKHLPFEICFMRMTIYK